MTATFPILVVDDEPSVTDLLQRAAKVSFPQASFINIASFDDAVAYIGELSGVGPRLVLLDIDLQNGRDGLDFLTLLRKHPQGAILPVVVLTSNVTKEIMEEAYRRGANAVTGKGFSFADWKFYVQTLRSFWFDTATTPRLYFDGEETNQFLKKT